jgi:hypothetical protein
MLSHHAPAVCTSPHHPRFHISSSASLNRPTLHWGFGSIRNPEDQARLIVRVSAENRDPRYDFVAPELILVLREKATGANAIW